MRWFDTLAVRARTTLSLRDYAPGLLSIVVPAYNVERHIDDCLRSIRGQNYRSIEILVVNDDSTDNTTRIA
ncbi:MAG: glycosyltransferase family 2 protein, partial [Propionibacteriales bacterium]|nr:glycosyltransferase family 2 protein [Propionibacteriales bacterium]